MQLALRDLRDEMGDRIVLIADLCLDEYTDHGHCGVLTADGEVDNDETIVLYAKAAIAQAEAGADVVAPSGMMDGQVGAIRSALDTRGYESTAILAYSAKYASALYGPFRDAVDVQIAGGGDRKGYQQDWHNAPRGARGGAARHRRGRRHRDGEARARVPRRHRGGARRVRRAGRRLSRVGGVRDDQGGRRERLDRRQTRWRSSTSRRSSEPAPTSSSRTSHASSPSAVRRPTRTRSWFERAQAVIPGGVNSPVRAFRSVGGSPYFVARAEGGFVWDVEGKRYTDFVQSYGAIILGHAHPKVVEAVQKAAVDGTSYGAPTAREVLLAEAICERVPSCERVRMVNSGTEATMTVHPRRARLHRSAEGS